MEDEEEDEDEDDEEDLMLTSKEPFRMITKMILAEFTVLKSGYRWTDQWNEGPTDRRTNKLADGQCLLWRKDTESDICGFKWLEGKFKALSFL